MARKKRSKPEPVSSDSKDIGEWVESVPSAEDSDEGEDASDLEEETRDSDSDSGSEVAEVQADFEFFDPQERDLDVLKALLQNYTDGSDGFDCEELVSAISRQSRVGTVVKCGEEGNPIGVASVLNFHHHRDLSVLSHVKSFILDNCMDYEKKEGVHKAMESRTCGLLINERLVNCPPELGPPLQQALFDEIHWATEDEPTEELRNSFKFKKYVILTRAFIDPEMEEAEKEWKPVEQKKKKSKSSQPTGLIYARPEDEFFHQFCSISYTFPASVDTVDDELKPLRLVMLIQANQIGPARTALDATVGNAAMG